MATVDDVEVANASFPNVRQDLNDILEALATNFSADAEPTTTYPNQFWYETDTNLLYIRNEANDAWVTLASINQTSGEWEPRTAVIQAIDSAGIALKTDDGTTRFSISDAGVVSFENYAFPSADGTAGQVLSTDGSGTLTFEDAGAGDKIEEGNSSVEVVDTGTGHVAVTVDGSETARFDANGRLGIGTNSPDEQLTLSASTNPTIEMAQVSGGPFIAQTVLRGNDLEIRGSNGKLEFYTGAQDGASSTIAGHFDSSQNFAFNSGYGSVATAYGCRAWVNFNGTGTVAIRDSGNVSSITDVTTGRYAINFATAMPDDDYAATAMGQRSDFDNGDFNIACSGNTSGDWTTTNLYVATAHASSFTLSDGLTVAIAVFR